MEKFDIDEELLASLKRTGENFFLVWPCVIAFAWAAENYSIHWLAVVATIGLAIVFFLVCVPNIGRIAALHKRSMGLSTNTKRHLVLADIGAVFTCAAVFSLWTGYGLAWVEASVAFAIAFINSLTPNNEVASTPMPEDPALGAIRAAQKHLESEHDNEIYDKYGNPTAPYLTCDNFRRLAFKCRSCTWWGLGTEVEIGETFREMFEIECPQCHTYIGAINYPVVGAAENKSKATYKGLVSEDDPMLASGPELFSRATTLNNDANSGDQKRRPNCRILDIQD
jgi:hypothetical protein